jgi:phenylpropionate dioxygenase-like ring-hydroxylating dioxygenase large terminal subunit
MFDDFANVWTIVGFAKDLKNNSPLALRVAGERIVFFRDENRRAVALLDRCPHRGAALSLGKVRDGAIECPFHGWGFKGDGANCGVPWNPDARLERLGGTALGAREIGGLLWLYTGLGAAPQEPSPPEIFARDDLTLFGESMVWNIHWTRAMENMLDWPHLPFVHAKTIGRSLKDVTAKRADVFWEERPDGGSVAVEVDGERREAVLQYHFPNVMELLIDPRDRIFRLFVACVPVDEERTQLLLFGLRNFLRLRVLDPFFCRMNRRIAAEDRAIVESSQPPRVPPPNEEISVRTDAPTLAFRRIYRQRLLGTRVSKDRVSRDD